MSRKIAKQKTKELSPLCLAVKRVREAHRFTQEQFARKLGITVTSLSRFETGRAEPRSQVVLMALLNYANDTDLKEEVEAFGRAYSEVHRLKSIEEHHRPYADTTVSTAIYGIAAYSLKQWRLMAAARIAVLYYPDRVAAMEQAAGPALALVDAVLRSADETQKLNYRELDYQIDALGERRALEELKQTGGNK